MQTFALKSNFYSLIVIYFFASIASIARAQDYTISPNSSASCYQDIILLDEQFPINDNFKEFIKNYVENTVTREQEAIFSVAFRNCYKKICDEPTCSTLPLQDLLEAFPELMTAFDDYFRSPRPPASGAIAGSRACNRETCRR